MKKIILSSLAIAAIALTSCKKDEIETNEYGTATINGTITADINQTNDLNDAGVYEQNYSPEGVEGMQVTVRVNTSNYQQNPVGGYNYDTDIHTTLTDANGAFTLTIPTTEEGFNVTIEFEDKQGITRTLYTTDGSTLTEEVEASKGNETVYIYNGADLTVDYTASLNTTSNDAYEYGSAIIRGTVYAEYDQGFTPETYLPLGSASPYPGKSVVLSWDYSPYGMTNTSTITATIDANGDYEIVLPTEVAGGNSVDWYLGMMDWNGTATGPNMAGTADSTWNAFYSCWLGGEPLRYYGVESSDDGQIQLGFDIYVDVYLLP